MARNPLSRGETAGTHLSQRNKRSTRTCLRLASIFLLFSRKSAKCVFTVRPSLSILSNWCGRKANPGYIVAPTSRSRGRCTGGETPDDLLRQKLNQKLMWIFWEEIWMKELIKKRVAWFWLKSLRLLGGQWPGQCFNPLYTKSHFMKRVK